MALVKGTNSYVDLYDADDYFDGRVDVAAWSSSSELMKTQALLTAAQIMDNQHWIGIALDDSQPLSFPREGWYFEPRLGKWIELTGIPKRIKNAQLELAYHLLNNDGLLDDTGSVKNIQVDTLVLTDIKPPRRIPNFVGDILRPLLQSASQAHMWWRAN
jgi:hypothetical protein